MLEAMAALILAIVGAMQIIIILAYGIYSSFYPLSKTVKGDIETMKAQAEESQKERIRGETVPEPTVAG
jgi:hypothetical protein